MNKFWNQTIEFKALIISLVTTVLGFGGTLFLFWLHRYDIPLAILTSGVIVSLSWLFLYLSKRGNTQRTKLDVFLIYARLISIVSLAILFTALELSLSLVILSPIALVVAYLVIASLTLIAYFNKGENNV